MRFAVVTKTPSLAGNLAAAFEFYTEKQDGDGLSRMGVATRDEDFERVPFEVCLSLRMPVFHVGEILILDHTGREVGYPGRKPSKWDVEIDEYDDVLTAVLRSKEVSSE